MVVAIDRPKLEGNVAVGQDDAELYSMPGESHLGGLGRAEEILRSMLELWADVDAN